MFPFCLSKTTPYLRHNALISFVLYLTNSATIGIGIGTCNKRADDINFMFSNMTQLLIPRFSEA
ncbi:hypothetical protein VFPPC_15944 [Pochonia chlamydosporia 170]|uniref:Uncharacterized protein n=1 Tax=Pochonia chlamydosporia 170 TaxID=1380566 RepID=A0A179EYY9_METCM|nr:hypothetical protein VFPPC_15944 [Pochonia chlamydosporia 170]OAQ65772.1 hypothetical protein VFPPC_15944 [Pochonia chlamydosporia 170]